MMARLEAPRYPFRFRLSPDDLRWTGVLAGAIESGSREARDHRGWPVTAFGRGMLGQQMRVGIICAAVLMFSVTTPTSATSEGQDCDRLAAHPEDLSRRGPGRAWEDLEPGLAIPACERAVNASPAEARFHYQLGRVLHKVGEHELAHAHYRHAADLGYAAAQISLGLVHDEGLGVPVDHEVAVAWYRKAAEQNDPRGQAALGRAYVNGRGVPRDYAKVARWHRQAAEQGQAGAQNDLGVLYALGWGVNQNDAEAFKWYRKSAEQDLVHAQYNLGVWYHLGRYVERDRIAAHLWYSLAARQGHENAAAELAVLVEQMSREEIAAAERKARDWRPR